MLNDSAFEYFSVCFQLPSMRYNIFAFVLVNVPFVLPLCLYILGLGVQQWRSGAKVSHTDLFTYNVAVVQLISIVGSCVLTVNWAFHSEHVVKIGHYTLLVTGSSNILFQIFTCLERYMAVVHPVAYLGLKSQTWTLVRNISCGFVWLMCVTQSVYLKIGENKSGFIETSIFGVSFCFLIVFFCNLGVLCVLVRPRPGDGTRGNTSKLRALYTITAITGTLMVQFFGTMLSVFSLNSNKHHDIDQACAFYFSVFWFTLPSSLVLPLLYLHRNGKMPCLKTNK